MEEKIPDDSELIGSVRDGDKDAYAEIVRRHHARVLSLCASLLKSDAKAEDAAQEVFLKAYRSLDRFRGDCAFSTWLHRVAANRCLDLLRSTAREKTDSLDAMTEGSEDGSVEFWDREPSTESAAEAADLAGKALARLPPEYRLILTLREIQGLSYEELTETLGCSLDSVKARLSRARKSLLSSLRHFGEVPRV